MANTPAKLTVNNKTLDLPVITGSENEQALDISKLRAETGCITMDLGFGNTGGTNSSITFLDGDKGILRYRGYPIEQLAEHSTFTEVAYLLIHGELPNATQLSTFQNKLMSFSDIDPQMLRILDGFPATAHPMAMLSSGVIALSAYYPHLTQPELSPAAKEEVMFHTIAKMATFGAAITKRDCRQDIVPSLKNCSFEHNFLHLLFSRPGKDYHVLPAVEDALRVLLILHEDHEQNCSTSTVRIVGSSQANLFSSVSAGISALWGPLHGGANQAMIEMLQMIKDDGSNYKKYIDKSKDKNDSFRLMGFGHRIYRNFDPRASVIKKHCDRVLESLGVHDPLLDIAKNLERIALQDDYFIERKLYPNVDFYSGIIYRAIGIPLNLFTVMFAIGRGPGWVAHWKEMVESPQFRIGRPRQIYTGATKRDYVPLKQRT